MKERNDWPLGRWRDERTTNKPPRGAKTDDPAPAPKTDEQPAPAATTTATDTSVSRTNGGGQGDDGDRLTTADIVAGTSRTTTEDTAAGTSSTGQTSSAAAVPVAGGERSTQATDGGERPAPLFSSGRSDDLREQWRTIQTNFVDDPRQAVQEADGLVAEVIKELAESFAKERGGLEQQWGRDNEVSTEDLRIALRRYRSFFHRLLSV
jgi:hypothetical protein